MRPCAVPCGRARYLAATARGGSPPSRLAPRCAAWHPAAWHRAPRWGGGVTGRRALRGYRGRTETPPAILSACATCHAPWACAPPVPRCPVPLRVPVVRSRCGRARCPHRAAAPSARCAAWHPAHAESFACRGLPAGAPRPRHGARQGRAPGAMVGRRASRLAPPFTHAIFARALPGRRDGDIAPYRHCPWRLAAAVRGFASRAPRRAPPTAPKRLTMRSGNLW